GPAETSVDDVVIGMNVPAFPLPAFGPGEELDAVGDNLGGVAIVAFAILPPRSLVTPDHQDLHALHARLRGPGRALEGDDAVPFGGEFGAAFAVPDDLAVHVAGAGGCKRQVG